jgi:hypothetical protein
MVTEAPLDPLESPSKPPVGDPEGSDVRSMAPFVLGALVVDLRGLVRSVSGVVAGAKIDDVTTRSGVVPEPDRTRTAVPDRIGTIIVITIALAASLGLLPWLGQSMLADEGATLYSAHLSWANLWAQSLHVDLVLLPSHGHQYSSR